MAGFSINGDLEKQKSIEEDSFDSLSQRLTRHSYTTDDNHQLLHNSIQLYQYEQQKKKKKYFLFNNILTIMNLVFLGFLLAMYIFLFKINFHRELFILFTISSVLITLFEIISVSMLSSLEKIKGMYISICSSLTFDLLQVICNIMCLIFLYKSSVCGSLFWNNNNCYQDSDIHEFIQDQCDQQQDSQQISNAIYHHFKTCLDEQKITKHQFESQMTIISNQAYQIILYTSIIYKMTINLFMKLLILIKCVKFNKNIISAQGQLQPIIQYQYKEIQKQFHN